VRAREEDKNSDNNFNVYTKPDNYEHVIPNDPRQAFNEGIRVGFKSGNEIGLKDGYAKGYDEGYNEGFREGYLEAKSMSGLYSEP